MARPSAAGPVTAARSGGSQATRDARAAAGAAARAALPPDALGTWAPAAGPPGSGGTARGAGGDPDSRARARALRPDGGVAVHLLPRRRPADGRRPAVGPTHGHRGPAVRRRAPRRTSASSRRPSATCSSTSTTSTRRLPRSVRMGPQAPRGKPRRRRPGSRASTRMRTGACVHARDPLLPGADGRATPRCARSTSTTPEWTRPGSSPSSTSAHAPMIKGTVKSAARHDALHRAAEADRAHRWRPPDRRAAADARSSSADVTLPIAESTLGDVPRDAPGGPARPPRPLRARRLRAQGGRCRERRPGGVRRAVHR